MAAKRNIPICQALSGLLGRFIVGYCIRVGQVIGQVRWAISIARLKMMLSCEQYCCGVEMNQCVPNGTPLADKRVITQ